MKAKTEEKVKEKVTYVENEPIAYWLDPETVIVNRNPHSLVATLQVINTVREARALEYRVFEAPLDLIKDAGIPLEEIRICDACDKHDHNATRIRNIKTGHITYTNWNDEPWMPPYAGYFRVDGRHGENIEWGRWCIPSSVVFAWEENHYLATVDGNKSYLMMLLRPAKTVDDAWRCLMPAAVQEDIAAGIRVVRQGEWYISDYCLSDKHLANILGVSAYYVCGLSSGILPCGPRENKHVAGRLIAVPNPISGDMGYWVRSFIAHPEHDTVYLKGWSIARRNLALQSWSTSGTDD